MVEQSLPTFCHKWGIVSTQNVIMFFLNNTSVSKTVLSLQLGGIIMMGDATVFPTLSDYNRVAGLLESLREDFPEFDHLEDEDHDGDADEEYLQ